MTALLHLCRLTALGSLWLVCECTPPAPTSAAELERLTAELEQLGVGLGQAVERIQGEEPAAHKTRRSR